MANYRSVSSVGAIVCITISYGCEPDRIFEAPHQGADAGAAGMGPSSGGGGGGGAGGEGSQDGGAGQTNCSEGQTRCDSACTDPSHDPQNCGKCGEKCSDTGACVDGQCWEWSEPVSFGKAEQLAPAVGPDGDAAIAIVPLKTAGAEVWSSYYDATTRAWGKAASLMQNNYSLTPPRFTGTKDVAYAVTDATNLGLQVLRRNAASGAFAPMTLTPSYPAASFTLSTSYDGDMVVTYSALLDEEGTKPYPLRVTRYDSDLASWGTEVELASDPTLYYLPVGTMLNASRDVHAFYVESALGPDNSLEKKRLLWRRWSKKDAAWQPQVEVTGGRGYNVGAITNKPNGSMAAVWTDTLPAGKPDLRVSRYKDDTATWTSDQLLETAEGAVISCAAAFSGTNLYVAWSQDGLDGVQVFLRQYDAATSHWLDAEQLTFVSLDSQLLSLRSDDAGALFLHWQDPSSGHLVARFDPKRKAWTKPMPMQGSDVASWGGGTLAVGPQGQAVLAWSDMATSGDDLEGHARYFGPPAP